MHNETATHKAPLVVGIGEVLWDKFPDEDYLGGASANFVFHAGQLGAASRLVSRIGRDIDGARMAELLGGRGISTAYIQEDADLPTGTVLVLLKDGQPAYKIKEPAAWDHLEMTGDMEALASRADAICFGTLAQRNAVSRRTIREFIIHCSTHAVRLFDINLRQDFYTGEIIEFGLQHATALKLNGEELARIGEMHGPGCDAKTVIHRLFERFPLELIALTLGAEGCELHTRGEVVRSAAVRVKCVDAVGAGDAFSAMLVMGLLRKMGLQEIADRANRVGAYVAGKSGAMPELPRELTGL